MTENISIRKRDGRTEQYNVDKIHRVLHWAAGGLDNVSVSTVELRARLQLTDGISTKDIHEALIKSAADLITEHTPEYSKMASRLNVFKLRKDAYGQFTPPSLYDHISKMVENDKYDKEILEKYTKEEIDALDQYIVHERDTDIGYSGIKQLEGKYLVQDRTTKKVYETPNMAFMVMSMALYQDWDKDERLDKVKDIYDAISTFKISLPTPIMGGVRTPTRQFSSCVVIECDDSLNSINATASSIVKYISQRAGIGVSVGRIRALGQPIRNGEAVHTGLIPFIKYFQAAVKSCSQGGLRGGAATVYYPLWHKEIQSLLVLKNNKGIEENRARHMDYGVQINKTLYQRLIRGEDIVCFSPDDVPGLYDAFFENEEEFARLYNIYENDPNIDKIKIPAKELFTLLAQERAQTGRIYIYNADNVAKHGPFNPDKAPVRQSNLCLEIALPTKPLNDLHDPDGEISLCTLAAVNVGNIDDFKDYEKYMKMLVEVLDNIIDYQDYPVLAAKNSNKARRSLGIGIINYAYFLAKHGLKYSDGSANEITHKLMEHIQYYGLKASMELAKKKGKCDKFEDTRYADGLLPIDWYKDTVDNLVDPVYELDWEWLRNEIKEHGLRNSTITALMPSETSSQVSGATNGIEPPRGPITVKSSKDGILKQPVPDVVNLKDKYEYLWNIPDNKGYLNLVAVMQKFVDQAISANTNYDPKKYPNEKVPIKEILKDILHAYKHGVKTLYYHNTRDGAGDDQDTDDGCAGGACKI